MPSVYIKTFGCQMNERDSEAVVARLVAQGYTLAESESTADVILLNTCSVRDMAEKRAIGKMTAVVGDARRAGRKPVLGFLGCMAQSRGAQLLEQLPSVKLVLGTQKMHHIGEHISALLAGEQKSVVDVDSELHSESRVVEHQPGRNVTAYVSIMQGCNQHCTFCIVPQTRGEERSRPIPEIVAECEALARQGTREVTLLGQIVTSYGRRLIPDKDGKTAFVQLLEAVQNIEGIERIRFTSPHPKGYGDDLAETYGRLSKVVESAHIPVQSGSNAILKAMHRGYTRERFTGIIHKLRSVCPDICVSTDFIAGFPGETEGDFEETLSLAREIEFDQAYIFKYSPRKDTPAAAMPGILPKAVLEERNKRLLETVNEIAARRYNACVGKVEEILVEGLSKRNTRRMMGRTRGGKIVVFDGTEESRGQLLQMKIVRAGAFTLYGEPV